jgi:hypothetical protein
MMKKGGRVTGMTGGGDTGVGRLQKSKKAGMTPLKAS